MRCRSTRRDLPRHSTERASPPQRALWTPSSTVGRRSAGLRSGRPARRSFAGRSRRKAAGRDGPGAPVRESSPRAARAPGGSGHRGAEVGRHRGDDGLVPGAVPEVVDPQAAAGIVGGAAALEVPVHPAGFAAPLDGEGVAAATGVVDAVFHRRAPVRRLAVRPAGAEVVRRPEPAEGRGARRAGGAGAGVVPPGGAGPGGIRSSRCGGGPASRRRRPGSGRCPGSSRSAGSGRDRGRSRRS